MTLAQDVRFGMRRLRHSPLFTIAVAATLSLAIAATVAVFSAVRAIVLRPLPIHQPERIAVLWETGTNATQRISEVSYRDYVDWRAQNRSFASMAAIGSENWSLPIDRGGELINVGTALVSASFFDVMGTRPQLGRVIEPADDLRTGAARVLLLSDRLWRQHFSADPAIAGTQVGVRADTFTIIGVMPPEFDYPMNAAAWTAVVPALASTNARGKVDTLEARSLGLLMVVGKLKNGVALEAARAEMDVISRGLQKFRTRVAPTARGVAASPLLDQIFGPTRRGLILLFAMVCFVLLIACANVASLVLARASALGSAFAIKSALGASRAQIIREWVVELAIVTTMASAIGVMLAWMGLRPLLAMAPSSLPRLDEARIDLPVLAFAIVVCAIVTLLCALVPAIQAAARAARDAMLRTRTGAGPRPLIGRGLLTLVQVALAMVLLTGAGLLVRSFDQLRRIDLGFQPQRVLTMDVRPQTENTDEYRAAYDAIIARVAALPEVEAVGAVFQRPLVEGRFGMDSGYLLEGQSIDRPESFKGNVTLNAEAVTPGYFDAMRIPLRRGRDFTARDTKRSLPVTILNESAARHLWPGKDPIGQRISVAAGHTEEGTFPFQTVVGVVADVRYRGIDDVRYDTYLPAAQAMGGGVKHQMVRTSGDPALAARSVRAAIGEAATVRTLIDAMTTMERITDDAVAPWRFSMLLLVGLAALGGVLAAAGLFALIAYSVEQRAQELAVRLAIGAGPGTILRMILWQGGRFALAGLAIGLLLSLAVTHRMSPLLFEVPARDALTFGAAACLLGATAFAASYVAARRVIGIDPVQAMRVQ